MWNDLPYTVFDTGTLDGFKGAVNRRLTFFVNNFVFALGPVLLVLIIKIMITIMIKLFSSFCC